MIVVPTEIAGTLNGIMTASAIQEMEKEYWEVTGPAIEKRMRSVHDLLLAPLVDKSLRICLRHDGVSYRKFMFDRVKLNIE